MTFRGEHKTPGGKLVAVEFEVLDGKLTNVTVTGDFFLYPEESLPLLTDALEGTPVSARRDDYVRRLAPLFTGSIELVGSSADGIAAALLRGLHTEERERSSVR